MVDLPETHTARLNTSLYYTSFCLFIPRFLDDSMCRLRDYTGLNNMHRIYGGLNLYQLLHIVPGYNNMFHVKHYLCAYSLLQTKKDAPDKRP